LFFSNSILLAISGPVLFGEIIQETLSPRRCLAGSMLFENSRGMRLTFVKTIAIIRRQQKIKTNKIVHLKTKENKMAGLIETLNSFWGSGLEMFLGLFEWVITAIAAFFAVKIWFQVRVKKAKKFEMGEDPIVVNWTGHPFNESWSVGVKIWNKEGSYVPKFNTDNPDTIIESAEKLVTDLPDDIEMRLRAGDPNVIIALPGLSVGLAFLLPVLHGVNGLFPTVTAPLRNPDTGKFECFYPVNLQTTRMSYRGLREVTK